jgi:arabinogalactan oligomer/maltooligosaccharide transport system substrate-binding protein
MLKSKSFLMSLILVSSIGLVACGGGNNDEVNAPANDSETDNMNNETVTGEGDVPEKPEQLTMWVNDEEAQLDANQAIAEKFTEEYGIEIEIIPFSMVDQAEGMSLDGPSGQGADLFFQPHDRMGDIHLQGLAAELELTDDQQERFSHYNEDAVASLSYEEIQYGIPAVMETYALFRNTELVPEAPETMEELTDIAHDLTDGNTYGFLMNATDLYFTYPFLTTNGGYVFGQDEDGVYDPNDIGLNSPEAVEGAKVVQSWFDEDLIPDGIDMDIVKGLFSDGKAGMVVSGAWDIPEFQSAIGDSMEISTLPKKDGELLTTFNGTKGWLVNYYTDHQYWATELALFLTNAENSQTYFEMAGEIPAHTEVEIEDELMTAFFDQIQSSVPMPNIPETSKVWEPMNDALEFISQGDDTQEVLDEAVEQIKEQISIMN